MQQKRTVLGAILGNTDLPDVKLNVELSTRTIVDLSLAYVCAGILVIILYNKFFK
ncbi:hypothetical protein [Mucilaginibacter terrenus]|uniref:hypothetical protein n=1 Tax=Mucilaginibacter terrenus TaxID=2482727 RepID=UPI001401D0C5|nr:hypothetical protein [Mucilaginibacter terrenus]